MPAQVTKPLRPGGPKERLKALLQRPDEELNLAEAALLVASEDYPGLDVDAYLHRLDELAAGVRRRLSDEPGLEETLVALNEFLFEEQGFSGNTEDYYDPRNSFLNEVLDRKLGIPITLSILYMEIGSRLGLALEGVSFPGHFLVKSATAEGDVVLDPFSGGMAVSEEDLVERLRQRFGEAHAPRAPLAPLLQAAGKKEILLRMLRNLKSIYLHQEEYARALGVIDRMLWIDPDLAEEVLERGQLYDRLECFRPALDDLRHYLSLNPAAPDAGDLRQRIIDLERLAARLN
jgi:regulator of sirC expression with transglutaminase-like and TPR domain